MLIPLKINSFLTSLLVTFPFIMFSSLSRIQWETQGIRIYPQPEKVKKMHDIKDTSSPTLSFSNYIWHIKSGDATPGPNSWSAQNAYVDSTGRLHLKISFNEKTQKWDCAEIWTTESFGFGTYELHIEGRLDQLDKNIVLGLFNYPASPQIPDGTNEIDIEFAKWGIATNKPGNFTVWPAQLIAGYTNQSYPFEINQSSHKTIHRFTWNPTSIHFQSFKGEEILKDSLISLSLIHISEPTRH